MRIIHFSDLHAREDMAVEATQTLDFILKETIRYQTDLVLFTGDFWDKATVNSGKGIFLPMLERVRQLMDVCPVVWIRGTPSHDVPGSLNVFKLMHSNSYVFEKPSIQRIDTPGGAAVILAVPEMRNVSHEEFLQELKQMRKKMEGHLDPKIFAGHLSLKECAAGYKEQFAFDMNIKELLSLQCNLYALGHIHAAHNFSSKGIDIVYAGSPYPLNFGEVEEKGFWRIDLNEKAQFEWVKTPVPGVVQFEDPTEEMIHEAEVVGKRIKLKFRQKASQSDIHIEEIKKQLLSKGAKDVVIEKVVIPQVHVRSPEIVGKTDLIDKLEIWCETVGEKCTPLLKKQAKELEEACEEG